MKTSVQTMGMNQYQSKQEKEEDARLHKFQLVNQAKFGGLFTQDEVNRLTQKIMKYYDGNGDGGIENMEVRNMMSDTYRAINKEFKPTATDLVQFTRVITRRTDAYKISGQDIHSLATNLFVGTNFKEIKGGMTPVNNMGQPIQSSFTTSLGGETETRKHAAMRPQHSQPKPQLSRTAQERLDVARRLFKRIDKDNSGFITDDEIPQLLQDTYAQMGIQNYRVSPQDVKSWMSMTDTNKDGKVTLDEYEALVIRSLQNAGISLN